MVCAHLYGVLPSFQSGCEQKVFQDYTKIVKKQNYVEIINFQKYYQ